MRHRHTRRRGEADDHPRGQVHVAGAAGQEEAARGNGLHAEGAKARQLHFAVLQQAGAYGAQHGAEGHLCRAFGGGAAQGALYLGE